MSDEPTADAPKPALQLWAEEVFQDVLGIRYRVTETLFSGESDFQRIEVVRTAGHGVMLFNDGLAMASERDEFVYHDMIAHVPLFVHPEPKRVLVIGGGDGGTVRECLRHPSVEHVDLVEIDPLVLEACRTHLRQTAAALDDPRCTVHVADGLAFVAEAAPASYDVVLVDSTDPIGPATPLFGEGFYRDVHKVLTDDGIVVSQGESVFYAPEAQQSLLGVLGAVFERVHLYNYTNLTYPGGLWSFTYATKGGSHPLHDFDDARVAASGLAFAYYSAAIHRAAFVLPAFQARNVAGLVTG